MPRIDIDQLPDSSRVFAYNTPRRLEPAELAHLRTNLEAFLDQWAAHGSPLTVGYALPHDQFIIIAVDDSKVGPSGCSIDASTQFLKAFTASTGIEILDAPDICYRHGDTIACVSRGVFAGLATAGDVDERTVVFDRTVSNLGDVRAGRWELPAGNAWHARAFKFAQTAGA